MHLPDVDLIEPFQPFARRQSQVDELVVHALDVGEHEQLFDGGVFAHTASRTKTLPARLPLPQKLESRKQKALKPLILKG